MGGPALLVTARGPTRDRRAIDVPAIHTHTRTYISNALDLLVPWAYLYRLRPTTRLHVVNMGFESNKHADRAKHHYSEYVQISSHHMLSSPTVFFFFFFSFFSFRFLLMTNELIVERSRVPTRDRRKLAARRQMKRRRRRGGAGGGGGTCPSADIIFSYFYFLFLRSTGQYRTLCVWPKRENWPCMTRPKRIKR